MNIRNINRFDPAQPLFLYSPADDGAGGSGTGNTADNNGDGGDDKIANNGGTAGNGNPNTDSQNSETRRAEITQAVKDALSGLLGKNNGDKDATLEELVKRNHGLEIKLDKARANVLPDADRKAFDAFKALNLSGDDLKNIVSEHGSWKSERANAAKTDALKKAAPLAGIHNSDLLASLDGALGVEYIVTGDGDKAVATVKFKDANGAEIVKPLADWAKEKWPALESTLFAPAGQKTVTPYGKSAPVGQGQGKNIWDKIREEKKPAATETAAPSWQEQVGLRT